MWRELIRPCLMSGGRNDRRSEGRLARAVEARQEVLLLLMMLLDSVAIGC